MGSQPRVAVVVLLGVLVAHLVWVPRKWLAVVAVLLLFAGLEFWNRWSDRVRLPFVGCLAWITASFCKKLAVLVLTRIITLHEWDFAGFWLHARSALAGINFYLPGSARPLSRSLELSSEFHAEIVDVGFWYPPPSMFFFLPAGLLDIQPALVLWSALSLVCLAGACFVLWRTFFPGTGLLHLAICSALVLACNGSFKTITYAQTTFLLLLLLSLFLSAPEKVRAGVTLALATFVKPLVAASAAFWLVRRRLRPIWAFIAASCVMMGASAFAFGGRTSLYFFTGDKGTKPDWIFSEPTNQSALGFLHRVLGTGSTCVEQQCLWTGPFLAFAAVTTVLSMIALWRLRNERDQRSVAVLLLFALMVYPVSQVFYSVMMVPVLLILWRARNHVYGGWRTITLLAAIDYALFFNHAFVAYLLTYAVLLSTVRWRPAPVPSSE